MNSLKITRHSQNHLVLTPSLPPSLTHFFTSSPTKNSLQLSVPLSSHLSIYHFFLSFLFLFALYLILKSQQALTNPILSLLSRSFFFSPFHPFLPFRLFHLPFFLTVHSPWLPSIFSYAKIRQPDSRCPIPSMLSRVLVLHLPSSSHLFNYFFLPLYSCSLIIPYIPESSKTPLGSRSSTSSLRSPPLTSALPHYVPPFPPPSHLHLYPSHVLSHLLYLHRASTSS